MWADRMAVSGVNCASIAGAASLLWLSGCFSDHPGQAPAPKPARSHAHAVDGGARESAVEAEGRAEPDPVDQGASSQGVAAEGPSVPECEAHVRGEAFCAGRALRTCTSLAAYSDEACPEGETCIEESGAPSCRYGVLQVSAGDRITCALSGAGLIDCWGLLEIQRRPARVGRFVALALRSDRVCGVTNDGHYECLGDVDFSSLGPLAADP